jgi:arylsulfatase A-like enzyme
MSADVGWFNIGAYHRGIMSGKTPNLDKLAADCKMFTDCYAEASCTAGTPISSPASYRFERV